MSHQDHETSVRSCFNHEVLRDAVDWLLKPGCFGTVGFRRDCSWTPRTLVTAVLFWAWSEEPTLKDRFISARKLTQKVYQRQSEPGGSYQAFLKLLGRWSGVLLFALYLQFHRRMQEELESHYRTTGFVVFGVDGSRIEVPRTVAHEVRFSGTYRGRKKLRGRRRQAAEKKATTPQMWLTTMWHVGSGLPWCWHHGASDSSERDHLRTMLDWLPENALLTADAGFVGYECWKQLLERGFDFVIRVGANVRLLRKLGYAREQGNRIYLWPDRAMSKHWPPLVLRLLVVHGKHPVYLVTSVLSQKKLTDRQLLEIYRARWGIEVFYRSFKQTFARRKLRSHCPQHACLELDWSLVGLWAVCLYAKCHQQRRNLDLAKTSVAGVLRAFRRTMRHAQDRSTPREHLESLLDMAVIDSYLRKNKTSRQYPRKKQRRDIGKPRIIQATHNQQQLAEKVKQELRLTA